MARTWNPLTVALALVALMAALAAPAQAAPGDLDPTFGNGGKVVAPTGSYDLFYDMALQADGKVVAVGTRIASNTDFVVTRYNADGSLDSSFSDDGVATTDFSGKSDGAAGVALQGDGKIVVVGTAEFAVGKVHGYNVALARYDADGSLDTSFSDDGKQTADLGGNENGNAVIAEPGGGILVAAAKNPGWGILRYQADGTRDMSFAGSGLASTDFGTPAAPRDAALAEGGRFVVAGTRDASSGLDIAVARYNADGSPDTSFDEDGKQSTDVRAHDEGNAVAVDRDGRTIVTGVAYDSGAQGDVAVVRYAADGAPDSSFGTNGVVTADLSGYESGSDVALQRDGKIVVAGDHDNDFAVLRLTPDGAPDPGFSGDGWQTTDFQGLDYGDGVATQADGKIIVGGNHVASVPAFALARYEGGDPSSSDSGESGSTGTVADTTAPTLTASLSPTTFAVDATGTAEVSVAKAVPKGTTFRYQLSEPARLVFTIEKRGTGRRVEGKCVKPKRSNRKKPRCVRYARVGRFAADGATGANTKRFSGRIGRRALKPGRYRAALVASDAAANASSPKRLTFRVVRGRG